MTYVRNNDNITVVDNNGEIIESFETSGCIYCDLGMCQGCPSCIFDNDDDERGE